ncbi:C-type mannose receptor 2-like [Anneissia japonica]|uniref:C-type mannose receptor 2-like n=1 Tax=Anneissia japonica TaxID=1529436 RepID=UPI0014258C5E|nr:C-type mannose receptor 2-like [Anneissia japonica]
MVLFNTIFVIYFYSCIGVSRTIILRTIVGGTIYYSTSKYLDFQSAVDLCKTYYGGNLPIIRTLEDYERLTALQERNFWLALNDREQEGVYVWTTSNGSYPLNTETFDGWMSNEPNNLYNEDCVIAKARKLKWNDVPCTLRKYIVCEKDFEISSIISDNVYYYLSGNMTFSEAYIACKNIDADLPVITNKEKNDAFHFTDFSFWLALNDNDTDSNYVWSTRIGDYPVNEHDFTAWNFHSIGFGPTTDNCVIYVYGVWSYVNCDDERRVVCEKESCVDPLGVEDGTIPSEQLTASSEYNLFFRPDHGRLNTASTGDYGGAWSAAVLDQNQWIQADLGFLLMVTGTITQGRDAGMGQWVTSYKVHYSLDGDQFGTIENASGQVAVFTGNSDGNTAVTNMFHIPVYAQYIRIHPMSWIHHICMRFEVIGCSGI